MVPSARQLALCYLAFDQVPHREVLLTEDQIPGGITRRILGSAPPAPLAPEGARPPPVSRGTPPPGARGKRCFPETVPYSGHLAKLLDRPGRPCPAARGGRLPPRGAPMWSPHPPGGGPPPAHRPASRRGGGRSRDNDRVGPRTGICRAPQFSVPDRGGWWSTNGSPQPSGVWAIRSC